MSTQILNSRIYSNPYQQLLYSSIRERYRPVAGTSHKALARPRSLPIFHIHWEETLFAKCENRAQALAKSKEYIQRLEQYKAVGGKIVWTLHNAFPHECPYPTLINSLRRKLARVADRILVHNMASANFLLSNCALDSLETVTILAHPAYFDVYEPTERSIECAGMPTTSKTILCFGFVRQYKNLIELLDKLPSRFLVPNELKLRFVGKPVRANTLVETLASYAQARPELTLTFEATPNHAVADLLRSHLGLLLPYHKIITSGVAVLGLTLGVPTVAPNIPAMRELFPPSTHHLLYNPRSSKDLQRAILELAHSSHAARREIADAYLHRAFADHPKLISLRLGKIYDDLLNLKN
ncbi:glycosyltransferase [Bordetella sp. 15P40C-2]|uniref:glycosyltransferase n=1 Tax=Bordetella sp. 15P40C-2 TaxID=2572246 RepID=UPI0013212E93|nr:glycosyltransferase [Bordetella sp. 15P40C-2]MVW73286.1 glycosyltransferase [Bordetella sp. 15P40C-2]